MVEMVAEIPQTGIKLGWGNTLGLLGLGLRFFSNTKHAQTPHKIFICIFVFSRCACKAAVVGQQGGYSRKDEEKQKRSHSVSQQCKSSCPQYSSAVT